MIRVGLTGGYATGKSTVTAMFAELGAPVIDADAVVRELLSSDRDVIDRATQEFGKGILDDDGQISRQKVADIVFSDIQAMMTWTEILYPVVRKRINHWFKEQELNGNAVAIAEVSMLIEGGSLDGYDKIVLVTAERKTQVERGIARGARHEDIIRRISQQLPLDKKKEYADFIIDNNGTFEYTKKQVREIWNALTQKGIKPRQKDISDEYC